MADPLSKMLPEYRAKMARKYAPGGTGSALMAQAPPAQAKALYELDRFREGQMQAPLTERESAYALAAAVRGAPVTAPPDPSMFDNARGDVSAMAHSVSPTTMIPGMASEVGKVWDVADSSEWEQFNRASGLEKIGAFFNLPGVRLLPGAYTLSNLRPGGPGLVEGFKEHPVISTLDVAPFISKGARHSKTFTAIEKAAPVGTRLPPVRTVLRNWHPGRNIDDFIETRTWETPTVLGKQAGGAPHVIRSTQETIVTPNMYGQFRDSARKGLFNAAPWLESAFGRNARNAVQARTRWRSSVGDMKDPSRTLYEGTDLATAEWEQKAADIVGRLDKLQGKYADRLTDDDYVKITSAAERGKFDDLTSDQRSYLDEVTSLSDELKQSVLADPTQTFWAEWEFTLPDGRTTRELLPHDVVYGKDNLFDTRRKLDLEEMAARARDARDGKFEMAPGDDPIKRIHDDLVTVLSDPGIKIEQKRRLVNAQVEALEAAGADVSPIRERLKRANRVGAGDDAQGGIERGTGGKTVSGGKFRSEDFVTAGSDIAQMQLARTGATVHTAYQIVNDTMGTLGSYTRRKNPDRAIVRLYDRLQRGDWKGARKMVNNLDTMPAGLKATGIDAGSLHKAVDHLQRLETQVETLVTGRSTRSEKITKAFTAKSLADTRAKLDQLESTATPARFDRILKDEIESRLITKTREVNDRNPDLASFERAISGGDWQGGGLSDKQIREIASDVQHNWKGLAATLDPDQAPIFIHHVSPEKALGDLLNPRIGVVPKTPTSAKKRLLNGVPYVKNPTVALSHQAVELLTYQTSRRFIDYALTTYGLPAEELFNRFRAEMPAHIEDAEGWLKAKMKKEGWRKFDPKNLGDARLAPSKFATKSIYVPRAFADTMDQLLKEHRSNTFTRTAAAPMNVFRTSVLALSPRWHLYNVVGGAVLLTTMASNPVKTWSMLPRAWKMVKEEWRGGAGLGHQDINLPAAGKQRFHEEWMQDINVGDLPIDQQVTFLRNVTAGRELRKLYEAASKSRLAKLAKRGIQGSYTANQFVDDMYRAMGYLGESDAAYKKAIRKYGDDLMGQSKAMRESEAAGVRAAREMFQEWDNMTPTERSVLRFITPFYSWTRHILKVVSHYPADHPWRTSILANFAANEMEDFGSGLPQRLYELYFMGDPDADGTQMTFNPGGMNPFKDVANYASLMGFFWGDGDLSAITTQLNPAIGSALEGMGVDVFKGQADMYPDLEYDSATGSLRVKQQTGPLSMLGNFIPQTEALANLSGMSAEFNRMQRRDPVAAASMLMSGVGIPANFRERNIHRETMLAELRRLESQDQAQTDALKTGNYDLLDQYPGLRAMRKQIESLTPEQLAPFRPDPALGQYGPRDLYGQMTQALLGRS